jgi:hypothetical protein
MREKGGGDGDGDGDVDVEVGVDGNGGEWTHRFPCPREASG